MHVDRKGFLQIKEKPATQENVSLMVAFNKPLPNISKFINKNRHNPSICEKLKKVSSAYSRNK